MPGNNRDGGGWLEQVERMTRADPLLRHLSQQADELAPARYELSHADAVVQVTLGRDGLPELIRIGPGWRRSIGAEGFADAVTAACRQAREEHRELWSRALDHDGWPARFSQALAYVLGRGALPEFAGRAGHAQAGRSGNGAGPAPFESSGGAAALGRLTLTVTLAREVTCVADPDWVGRQEAEGLSEALASALAQARAGFAG